MHTNRTKRVRTSTPSMVQPLKLTLTEPTEAGSPTPTTSVSARWKAAAVKLTESKLRATVEAFCRLASAAAHSSPPGAFSGTSPVHAMVASEPATRGK